MNLRLIDWIWIVRGSLALAPGQTSDDALDRLLPLFRQTGTSHERGRGVLTFRKRDQAAQDRMSIFDGGALRVEPGAAGPVLRYELTSRALLFCFLAPLLFLAIAQFTVTVMRHQPSPEATGKSAKAADAKRKLADEAASVPMNPIDKALGAPAPEKPKKASDKPAGRDKKPSPTPAYVFAAIFATLYIVGRVLEDRLVKSLFKGSLLGQETPKKAPAPPRATPFAGKAAETSRQS